MTTRYRVLAKDAGAAAFLYAAYGAGPWRYPDSCPKCRTKWPIVVPKPSDGLVPQSASDRACLPLVTPTLISQVLATTRCDDNNANCPVGAKAGLCTSTDSTGYMVGTVSSDGSYNLGSCLKSCGVCKAKSPFTTPCQDTNQYCRDWAANGECTNNPNYMFATCLTSCGICAAYGLDGSSSSSGSSTCGDLNKSCAAWAARGECTNNPGYMTGDPSYNFPGQCLNSCGKC